MPKLTVLIENNAPPEHQHQHGLSLWVEAGAARLLIDTGQDGAFLQNATALGIDTVTATHLCLTHGHYDHTGGVPALLATGVRPTVVLHAEAFAARRSLREGEPPRSIGIPWAPSLLHDCSQITVTKPTLLLPGVYSSGSIPNYTGQAPNPCLQREMASGWNADPFTDEQAIVLTTTDGLVVITGCCHAGVVNTLLAAQAATGIACVHALVGGLHLHHQQPEAIRQLADALRPFDLQHLLLSHCTGPLACEILREELGEGVRWAGTGFTVDFPELVKQQGGVSCP
jgi:7,8-dihydropterin-6-yl-methyl-4-(beta-D-ribofuranosyl)aminobenzene 5'-phosphate synthase